jgi:hypothetical protein
MFIVSGRSTRILEVDRNIHAGDVKLPICSAFEEPDLQDVFSHHQIGRLGLDKIGTRESL